jgi:uncharacterized membrane protein YdbT with pleckstrin-like domain
VVGFFRITSIKIKNPVFREKPGFLAIKFGSVGDGDRTFKNPSH